MSNSVLTPIGRVSYPHLFKPQQFKKEEKPRQSVVLIFGPDADLSPLKAAVAEAIKEEFGDKPIPEGLRSPFRKGSEKRTEDGEPVDGYGDDDIFCTFWRYEEKGMTKPVMENPTKLATPGDIYAGCLGRVLCRPYVYNNKGNRGVSFSLEAFQRCGDGNPIGSAPADGSKVFESVVQDAPELSI